MKVSEIAMKTIQDIEEIKEIVGNLEVSLGESLYQRSFMRRFLQLSEDLIYFRDQKNYRITSDQIEYLKPQFEILRPIIELDIEKDFNKLRNTLIHPKLIYFRSANDLKDSQKNTFWEAINFFHNNGEKLREAALKIYKDTSFVNEKNIDVNKISFDPVIQGEQPVRYKKVSIYHHYYLPLEMAIDEIENLNHLLRQVNQPYSVMAVDAINNLCESVLTHN